MTTSDNVGSCDIRDTCDGAHVADPQVAIVAAVAVMRAKVAYIVKCKDERREPKTGILADLHFHDLRREATSRLDNVFKLHELTKIVGHSSPAMLHVVRPSECRRLHVAAGRGRWS